MFVRNCHAHRRRIAFVQPLQNHARYVRQDNNTPQSAREAHYDRSVRPCSSRHGRHPCLFRHSLRAGQLTVKGIARVQPVSFRPPCYNPLLRVQHRPCHPDQLTPGVIMNMQSLFTLLPFIVLAIGITRVYCTIKEI